MSMKTTHGFRQEPENHGQRPAARAEGHLEGSRIGGDSLYQENGARVCCENCSKLTCIGLQLSVGGYTHSLEPEPVANDAEDVEEAIQYDDEDIEADEEYVEEGEEYVEEGEEYVVEDDDEEDTYESADESPWRPAVPFRH